MKKIILHIGMHKTGSTAIQVALDRLDSSHVAYADLGMKNHSIPFYTAYSINYLVYHVWTRAGLNPASIENKKSECLKSIESALKKNNWKTIIFSGEDISLLSEKELIVLKKTLTQYTNDIRIYAYFRHPTDYIRSATAQLIHDGSGGGKLHPLNYKEVFSKFANVFNKNKLNLRQYDTNLLEGKDIVSDFCSWIGIGDLNIKSKLINPSISTNALRCIYLLNCSNPLTLGDHQLELSRIEFVKVMTSLFPGKLDIPNEIINPSLNLEDIRWMEALCGIKFNLDINQQPNNPIALDEYLSRVPDDVIDTLLAYLKSKNVNREFNRNAIKLVNRIFYLCLVKKPKKDKYLSFSTGRFFRS